MTSQSDTSDQGAFSSFAFGLTIGVIGALAFGTEEGRKVVKKLIDSISDQCNKPPVNTFSAPRTPIFTPEETPHHSTFESESPPPLPPAVSPTRPEPFHPTL